MKGRGPLEGAGDVGYRLLKITKEAADAFPPLKIAAGVALAIADIKIVSCFLSNSSKVLTMYRNMMTP
jgi:hypothetical protein